MSLCPRCQQRLVRSKVPQGVVFVCPRCKGRAIGLPVLRRMIPDGIVNGLWLQAHQEGGVAGVACPICQRTMAQVSATANAHPVTLDVCTGCQFVWFDPNTLEQLPAAPCPPRAEETLPEAAREQIALMKLKSFEEQQEAAGTLEGGGPEETWKLLPAALGMPVEVDANPLQGWPWLTWGLALVMVLVYLLTMNNLGPVVEEFGLIPNQLWRHGGATFITSFFLHGGPLHLVGNTYFLLIFGSHVEDHVGRGRYALLLAVSALLGDALHVLWDPQGAIPCIGASGGISGALAFYALRFPHARLGLLVGYSFMFRWYRVPAVYAFGFWIVLQLLLAAQQLAGVGHVSALAHLGGCLVGVAAWLVWRTGMKQAA